jgi:hypothetical protein
LPTEGAPPSSLESVFRARIVRAVTGIKKQRAKTNPKIFEFLTNSGEVMV